MSRRNYYLPVYSLKAQVILYIELKKERSGGKNQVGYRYPE